MPRGTPYSDEVKAQVIAALATGEQPETVAARTGIPKQTVSRWKKGVPELVSMGQDGTKKGDRVGDLVSGYLEEMLVTLTEQAKYFRSERWLHRQPASSIAVLHGVLADKTLRILEAAEQAAHEGSGEQPG